MLLLLSGCAVIRPPDGSSDVPCREACRRYRDCYDANLALNVCESRCMKVKREDVQRCNDCTHRRSCSARCEVECERVVP
ncbi:MAG: hypothetical protein QM817_37395 [Archangium sp.]